MKSFIVEEKDSKKRIDLFIMEKDLTMTRTSAKKLIMEGLIRVNNEQVRPNYWVKVGERITLDANAVKEFLEDTDSTSIIPTKMKLDIVYEDFEILLLNKAAGLVVHPVYTHKDDTLLNGVVYYFQQKGEAIKARPVHRLDKETSGIILFSKNKEANERYSKVFEEHNVEKTYYAVVAGDFKEYMVRKNRPEMFEYFTYISKDKDENRAYFNTSKEKGLAARTRIFFVEYWGAEKRSSKIFAGKTSASNRKNSSIKSSYVIARLPNIR